MPKKYIPKNRFFSVLRVQFEVNPKNFSYLGCRFLFWVNFILKWGGNLRRSVFEVFFPLELLVAFYLCSDLGVVNGSK